MAIGLTAAMTAARSSLTAQQQALAVTANNISNANNTKYHKQSVLFTDNVEILDVTGYYGTGVSVGSISRAYSSALESSLANAYTSDGYNQTSLEYSSQVESLLVPDGESTIVDNVTNFMDAMQSVQTAPEDSTYREEFISAAQTLAETLNTSYSSLSTICAGIASSSNPTGELTGGTAKDAVDEVNTLLEQLSSLNEQISNLETYSSRGSDANDLRDTRDALVQDLSKYLKVNVSEGTDSRYTITTTDDAGNSVNLLYVSGTGTSNYKTEVNSVEAYLVDGEISFQVTDSSSGSTYVLKNTGELGAYSDSYSYVGEEMKKIYNPDYDPLDATTYPGYAQAIAEKVNGILEGGYDLNGNTGVANDVFVELTGAYSGSVMTVVSGFKASQVAASDTAGVQGNGNNMDALWNYFQYSDSVNQTVIYSGIDPSTGLEQGSATTLGGYANSYVNDIASTVSQMGTSANTSAATVTMYQNAIAGTSGVNSDVELTNMLAIQQAYAASAKVISTIQSMYDTIFATI